MNKDLKKRLIKNIVIILIIYIFLAMSGIIATSPCDFPNCKPTFYNVITLYLLYFGVYGIIFIPILVFRIKSILKNAEQINDK